MGQATQNCPETSVYNCHETPRNNAVERKLLPHRSRSKKYHLFYSVLLWKNVFVFTLISFYLALKNGMSWLLLTILNCFVLPGFWKMTLWTCDLLIALDRIWSNGKLVATSASSCRWVNWKSVFLFSVVRDSRVTKNLYESINWNYTQFGLGDLS